MAYEENIMLASTGNTEDENEIGDPKTEAEEIEDDGIEDGLGELLDEEENPENPGAWHEPQPKEGLGDGEEKGY